MLLTVHVHTVGWAMGAKMRQRNQIAGQQDADPYTARSKGGGARQRALMKQIADALHVPTDAFYAQSVIARSTDEHLARADSAALDAECATLLKAYRRIADPSERQRLLILVRKAAPPDRQ